MVSIIHFEDDIFFLTHMIKRMKDALMLDLDPAPYRTHILDEISFLSRSILFFFDSLKTTQLKVKRLTHMKSIYKANQYFVELLNALCTAQYPFAKHVRDHLSALGELQNRHNECDYEIKNAINDKSQSLAQEHEALTEEEYRVLLSSDEEQ